MTRTRDSGRVLDVDGSAPAALPENLLPDLVEEYLQWQGDRPFAVALSLHGPETFHLDAEE